MSYTIKTVFKHTGEDWSAMRCAERYILEQGWTVGPSDMTGNRCVMRGDYRIAKWKNLSHAERGECDGKLVGRGRDTERTLVMFASEVDQ